MAQKRTIGANKKKPPVRLSKRPVGKATHRTVMKTAQGRRAGARY
jgi:hypothetical protein